MDADYNIEWRVRRWAKSLQPSQIARILSSVPLLITPPVGAMLIAFYLRQSARYGIKPAEARGIYAVSIVNIILSLIVLNTVGGHLIALFWSAFDAMSGHTPENSSPLILI